MSMHIFANIVTPFGTASNNRGETDGNTTTLQKLVWKSQVHTTVSAEASFVRNGRREDTMPSSRVPCLSSLYSTVFMIEIIMIR